MTSTNLNANFSAISSVINGNIDATNITAGSLTTTQLSSSANIAASQLASTTPGYVMLGLTTTGVPTWTPLSGDVTVTGGGVTAIGASKVTNAMLAGSITGAKIASGTITESNVTAGTLTTASLSATAGITSGQLAGSVAFSKLATLTSGNILVGNGSNVATSVAVSGDAALANTGALTIGTSAVTTPKFKPSQINFTGSVGSNFTTTSATFVDITGFSTTYQAGATNERLFLWMNVFVGAGVADANVTLNAAGTALEPYIYVNNVAGVRLSQLYIVDVSAGVTVTLKGQGMTSATTLTVNRSQSYYAPTLKGFSVSNV